MSKNSLVTVIDIGTSKVVCFIARIEDGNMEVIGIGHQMAYGMKAGIIIDMKQVESSILGAVHTAEKMAGITIEKAVVNISGNSIQSENQKVKTEIAGNEVTDRDINHVIAQGYQERGLEGREILHCIPYEYQIDDSSGIHDPRGMFGKELSTSLHISSCSSTVMRNITNCLGRCHIAVDDYIATPYASALACITDDEKNLGSVVIDIGAGNTSVAIYKDGYPVYFTCLSVGGEHITRDIAKGVYTTIKHAERIKTLYGSVINTAADAQDIIDIPLSEIVSDSTDPVSEDMYVSRSLLTSVIKPRVEEILEMVADAVNKSGYGVSIGPRVVLTGGGSQIQGIRELAGHMFNKHVRQASPSMIEGMAESTAGPSYSSSVGMLKYVAGQHNFAAGSMEETEHMAKTSGVGKIVSWIKNNF